MKGNHVNSKELYPRNVSLGILNMKKLELVDGRNSGYVWWGTYVCGSNERELSSFDISERCSQGI